MPDGSGKSYVMPVKPKTTKQLFGGEERIEGCKCEWVGHEHRFVEKSGGGTRLLCPVKTRVSDPEKGSVF